MNSSAQPQNEGNISIAGLIILFRFSYLLEFGSIRLVVSTDQFSTVFALRNSNLEPHQPSALSIFWAMFGSLEQSALFISVFKRTMAVYSHRATQKI